MKAFLMRSTAFLLLCALFCVMAGCSTAPAASPTPMPTAPPEAQAVFEAAEEYPEETPAPEPTAEPTAEPTPEAAGTPAAEPAEITAEITAMYPLLEAHVLALLNGGRFDPNDPVYFWQTIAFAMDSCGLDFYTSETMGSALVLSRGVIEEMASGLFENGGAVLLEIPAELSEVIVYDQTADAFSHPVSEGSFRIEPESLTETDGALTLTAGFFAGEDPEPAARFTVVLVPNTRTDNSLFTCTVREIALIE